MRPWQHGYEREELAPITALFDEHDRGLLNGRTQRFHEARVADALARGQLVLGSGWALQRRIAKAASPLRDFAKRQVGTVRPGSVVVPRLAYRGPSPPAELVSELQAQSAEGPLVVTLWQEHPGDLQLAAELGLQLAAYRVEASSELRSVWSQLPSSYAVSAHDWLGIRALQLPPFDVEPLRRRLEELELQYAQHYSTYNVRRSWSALALRGFSDDPEFIEKPAEMARSWRQAHPELLRAACRWTPLAQALPEALELVEQLPGQPERVRLMRVTPGGALARHADIIDQEVGLGLGQLARIHIPVQTAPAVTFTSWLLSGERQQRFMPAGQATYLDTRKPHAAANESESDRVHLVVDLRVTAELRELLA